jgi:hypothetical protein
MTVDITLAEVTTVAGKDVGTSGVHDDSLNIAKTVAYNDGIYTYTMTFTNSGEGNVKVEMILVDLPARVDYVAGSTIGDLYNGDPVVAGDSGGGITIYWDFIPPQPNIPEGGTREHIFQLSGPAGVAGVEGHACIRASRQDVGTVWDVDSSPYSLTAQARDASNEVIASVRVGLWEGGQISIGGWDISP